jgi:hypothetical protein
MVLHVDTDQLAWLRGQVSAAAGDLDEKLNEPPTYTVPASAFGNTLSADDCSTDWDSAVSRALGATSALQRALSADVTRLGGVVETFIRMDDEAADQILAAGSQMTFISSHVQSNSGRFPDAWNDYLRARQLDRLVDYASDVQGPVAIGGDDNVSLIDDEQHDFDRLGPDALERFEDEGYANVGDVSDQGGTLDGSGRSIDHIHARGVEAGEPALVDGGPSDHHGQAVTYALADW